MKVKMKTAWLITWEWTGDHAAKENKIVSILNYRFSEERVRKYIEQRYVDLTSSPSELLIYAKSWRDTPYPATFTSINRIPYMGRIHCGHNPHLFGRLVKNISIEIDDDGNEKLIWEEIPISKELKDAADLMRSSH